MLGLTGDVTVAWAAVGASSARGGGLTTKGVETAGDNAASGGLLEGSSLDSVGRPDFGVGRGGQDGREEREGEDEREESEVHCRSEVSVVWVREREGVVRWSKKEMRMREDCGGVDVYMMSAPFFTSSGDCPISDRIRADPSTPL